MSDGLLNGNVRKVAESTAAVVFARIAMPIMVALVGAAGSYILHDLVEQIKDVKETVRPIWSQLGETNKQLNTIQTSIAAGSAKQDEITSTTRGILTDHENRIRVLEHPH